MLWIEVLLIVVLSMIAGTSTLAVLCLVGLLLGLSYHRWFRRFWIVSLIVGLGVGISVILPG